MLDKLPAELVDNIGLFMTTRDIGSLRLTSHNLCEKSTHALARAAFTTVTMDRMPKSVDHFCITEKAKFRHAVKKLVFTTPLSPLPTQTAMLDTENAMAFMGRMRCALEKLPNCKSFEIVEAPNEAGDGLLGPPITTVTLVGLVLLIGQPGVNPRELRIDMAHSSLARLTRVDTELYTNSEFVSSWASLHSLRLRHLLLTIADRSVIQNIIKGARTLQTLDMDFQINREDEYPTWGAQLLLKRLAGSSSVPPIRTLRLTHVRDVHQETLAAFLCRFQDTLVELHMENIHLEDCFYRGNEDVEGVAMGTHDWRDLLVTLAGSNFKKLERITINSLTQLAQREGSQVSEFDDSPQDGPIGVFEQDLEDILEQILEEHMEVELGQQGQHLDLQLQDNHFGLPGQILDLVMDDEFEEPEHQQQPQQGPDSMEDPYDDIYGVHFCPVRMYGGVTTVPHGVKLIFRGVVVGGVQFVGGPDGARGVLRALARSAGLSGLESRVWGEDPFDDES